MSDGEQQFQTQAQYVSAVLVGILQQTGMIPPPLAHATFRWLYEAPPIEVIEFYNYAAGNADLFQRFKEWPSRPLQEEEEDEDGPAAHRDRDQRVEALAALQPDLTYIR